MNKLYSVHDHWTDINKKNDVDIESIDGVITGIKVNGEDYSGNITWESVYSDSIDPEGEVSPFTAYISLTMTATDLIKVVYDGVEYVLPKQVFNEKIYYGAVPAFLPADIDFTNYPFLIQVSPEILRVYTETAGLHTLAISVPQSGGGESDFSTAEVTFENVDTTTRPYQAVVTSVESDSIKSLNGEVLSPFTVTVPLYKGKNILPVSCIRLNDESYMPTTEGSVEFSIESMGFVVTGDGTIKAKGLSGAN